MKLLLLNFTVFFLLIQQIKAQPGRLDSSFGTNGRILLGTSFTATAFQPDGKLVAVWTSNDNLVINRFDTFGLDTTFGTGGTITADLGSSYDRAISVAVGSDNKIVVLGITVASQGGIPSTFLVLLRYQSDGTPDTSFGNAGMVKENIGPAFVRLEDSPREVAIKKDGKIVVSTQWSLSTGTGISSEIRVRGYDVNGNNSFGASTGYTSTTLIHENFTINDLLLQNDGRIVVGGSKERMEINIGPIYTISVLLFRLTSDGKKDSTFGNAGIVLSNESHSVYTSLLSMSEDFNGKILASATGNRLLRFNVDGTPDMGFGTAGIVTTDLEVRKIGVQGKGKIIVAGNASGNFAVARYNSNGTIDETFGRAGVVTRSSTHLILWKMFRNLSKFNCQLPEKY